MSVSPQFVCLSMLVNGLAWHSNPNLTWTDCIAYAIEREGDPVDLPPLVHRTVDTALSRPRGR